MVNKNIRKLGKKKGVGGGLAVIGIIILILFIFALLQAFLSS